MGSPLAGKREVAKTKAGLRDGAQRTMKMRRESCIRTPSCLLTKGSGKSILWRPMVIVLSILLTFLLTCGVFFFLWWRFAAMPLKELTELVSSAPAKDFLIR